MEAGESPHYTAINTGSYSPVCIRCSPLLPPTHHLLTTPYPRVSHPGCPWNLLVILSIYIRCSSNILFYRITSYHLSTHFRRTVWHGIYLRGLVIELISSWRLHLLLKCSKSDRLIGISYCMHKEEYCKNLILTMKQAASLSYNLNVDTFQETWIYRTKVYLGRDGGVNYAINVYIWHNKVCRRL